MELLRQNEPGKKVPNYLAAALTPPLEPNRFTDHAIYIADAAGGRFAPRRIGPSLMEQI
jgi:hypothetical protein